MKNYVLFFTFILWHFSIFTNATQTAGSIVKPGYYEIPGTKAIYKYHSTLSEWDDAVATCAAEGASLYYAENEIEFNKVITFWRTVRNDFLAFFVGIRKYNGVFTTLSGTPMSKVYQGWLPGEPDNAGGKENCVEAKYKAPQWGYNDIICNSPNKLSFICKVSLVDVQCSRTPSTNPLPTAYSMKKANYYEILSTNGLYKFHNKLSTWDEAAATCAAEGTSLYYAENEREFNTVLAYWRTVINTFPREFWLGLKKLDGNFKTISGVPISKVYAGWLPGEPNNSGGDENCVEARNQTNPWGLNDKACHNTRSFICKWPVNNMQCTISADGPTEGNIGLSTGYRVIPTTNAVYKYHDKLSVWDDAAATCAAEGASLYYAENKREFETVITFWRNSVKDFPYEFFIGMRKRDGVFKTMTGVPIANVFNEWAPGEPNNNGGNEDCVEAGHWRGPWEFNDKACSFRKKFLCKAPVLDEQCTATSSIGYKYFEPLGRCYKVHQIPRTWTEAQAACKAEGSNLAVINSIEEAAHLVQITNKINYVPGNFMRGSMLLGFYKQKGDWYTIQGKPMPSNGYPCWGNQQPDGGDAEQCGAMFHNGRLTNVRCDKKALFICEHVVNDPDVVTEPKSEWLSTFECDMVYKSIFSYYPFFK